MENSDGEYSRVIDYFVKTVLFCGFILRTMQYSFNRSLWLDESILALNIVNRTFYGLTKPLEYNQGAPLLFLFAQKLVISVFGNSDYALRAFPYFASIISLVLVYYVANVYAKGIGRAAIAALFSFNSWLIYYSSECKQYSSDVMVALLILYLASRCTATRASKKNILLLTFSGCVSMWLSHPALFVIAGVGLGAIADLASKADVDNRGCRRGMLLVWFLNFLLLYVLSFKQLASNPVLLSYWNEYFMPMPPWSNPIWFPVMFVKMLTKPLGLSVLSVSSILVIIGCITYLIKKKRMSLIIITPIVLTLLASALKKYPFGDRLLLFAVPFILILIAEGVEQLRNVIAKRHSVGAFGVCVMLTVVITFNPATEAIETLRNPYNNEDIKTVLKYIQHHKRADDMLYVYNGAIPAFEYYAESYNLENQKTIEGIASRDNPNEYIADLEKLRGKKRVWFIFSHDYNWNRIDEEEFFKSILNKIGAKADEVKSDNASGYLYLL